MYNIKYMQYEYMACDVSKDMYLAAATNKPTDFQENQSARGPLDLSLASVGSTNTHCATAKQHL